MDGLCELTSRIHQRKPSYDIPEPDYDTGDEVNLSSNRNRYPATVTTMGSNENVDYDSDENHGSLSPQQIRAMMSKEQKELQRDLKIMQKRGMDFQAKRPEFKAKHHEIMAKGQQRKESKEVAESELSTKLKSRSEKIEQAEKAKKIEDDRPEFLKVNLKKGKGNPNVQ
eukprot:gene529-10212_t